MDGDKMCEWAIRGLGVTHGVCRDIRWTQRIMHRGTNSFTTSIRKNEKKKKTKEIEKKDCCMVTQEEEAFWSNQCYSRVGHGCEDDSSEA